MSSAEESITKLGQKIIPHISQRSGDDSQFKEGAPGSWEFPQQVQHCIAFHMPLRAVEEEHRINGPQRRRYVCLCPITL